MLDATDRRLDGGVGREVEEGESPVGRWEPDVGGWGADDDPFGLGVVEGGGEDPVAAADRPRCDTVGPLLVVEALDVDPGETGQRHVTERGEDGRRVVGLGGPR